MCYYLVQILTLPIALAKLYSTNLHNEVKSLTKNLCESQSYDTNDISNKNQIKKAIKEIAIVTLMMYVSIKLQKSL